MRETRQSGSEGGEAKCLPYPYHGFADIGTVRRGWRASARHDGVRPARNTRDITWSCASPKPRTSRPWPDVAPAGWLT